MQLVVSKKKKDIGSNSFPVKKIMIECSQIEVFAIGKALFESINILLCY